MRRVVVLGSTGSVGSSTIDVCRALGRGEVEVVGLAAGRRWEALAEQALSLGCREVALADEGGGPRLRARLDGTGVLVHVGQDAARSLVERTRPDAVLASVSGAAGLPAVLQAASQGARLCLSNKESLVVAGPILGRLAAAHGAELLPVDSEHSAIFQALRAGATREVKRLILTASGGPFRTWSKERMAAANREQALAHPTWRMGPAITIDSATLMNKALEIIEARWLFGVAPEQIDVIVHPQSIVHSLVEFVDGSVLAQLGVPDMRVPIQYALTYPHRAPLETERFDLAAIASLTFEAVDAARFPAIRLAYEVLNRGGVAGAVFNAANEVARGAFLEERATFPEIVATVEAVLESHGRGGPARDVANPDLEQVLEADRWAREEAAKCLRR